MYRLEVFKKTYGRFEVLDPSYSHPYLKISAPMLIGLFNATSQSDIPGDSKSL